MGKTEDIPYFGYLSSAALSDVGRKRKNNEDNYGAFADYGLFCVADGMGGASDGEVASRIVVEHLSATIKNWKKFKSPIPLEDRLALVDKTLDAASAWINQYADSHEARGCGTTFVGVVLDPADATKAVAMHAGDSRLYLIHKKKISQITNDHSVANMTGIKNEADLDPVFRNMILRAVGIKPTVELERTPFRISEGDSILICSDGLTKMLSDKQILKIILETQNCHKGVRLLIDEANRLGGKDNVTAILVNITYIPPVREVHPRLSEEEFLSCLRNAETDACATTESAFTMPTTATSSTYDDFSDSTQRDDTWLDNDSDDVISGTLEQQSTGEAFEGEVQKTHIPEQVNGKAEDVCNYQSQVEGLSGDCNLKKGIRNTGNNNHISVTNKKNLIVCSIISILVVGIFAIYNIKHNKEIARQAFNSNVEAIIAELESLKSEIESAETLNGYSNEILSAASSFENEIREAKLNSLSEEDFQESIASFRLATNGLVKAVNERQEQIAVEQMALKKKLADATIAFDRTLARAKDNLNKLQSSIASSEKLDGIKTNLEAIKSEVKQAEHLANDAGVPTEERLKEAGVNRLFADIEDEIESREKVLAALEKKLADATAAFDRTLARAKDNLNKLRSSIASSEKLDGIKTNLEAIKSEVKQAEHLANDAGVPTEERLKEAGVNRLFADIEDEIESREKVLAALKKKLADATAAFDRTLARAKDNLNKLRSSIASSEKLDGIKTNLEAIKSEVKQAEHLANDAGVPTEERLKEAGVNRLFADIEDEIESREKVLAALKKKLADATAAFDRTLARAKDNLNKLRSSIASSEKLDGIKTNLEAIKSEVKQAEHLANDAGVPTEERLKEAGVNRLFADIEDEIESREKVLAAEAEMMAGMKFKFINDSWEEGGHVVWSNSTIQIRDKPDIISKSSLSETKENSNYIAFWGTRENETQPRFLHVISLPLSQINGHIACIKLSHTNCLDITHLDEYINEFKKNSNDTRVYPNYTRKCNEKWKDMKEISNAMLESHEKLKKVVLDYIWLVKFLMEKNQEFDFKKVDFENWEKSVNVDNK